MEERYIRTYVHMNVHMKETCSMYVRIMDIRTCHMTCVCMLVCICLCTHISVLPRNFVKDMAIVAVLFILSCYTVNAIHYTCIVCHFSNKILNHLLMISIEGPAPS